RALHPRKTGGLQGRATHEVSPEERGGEGPQETRRGPRRSETGSEEGESEAGGARAEAHRYSRRSGARDTAHDPGEGTSADGGRTRDHGGAERDRPLAAAVRRGRA